MAKKNEDILNECGHRNSERVKALKEFPSSVCPACLLERIKELERRLSEHLKGHSLEAICDECSSHYWYVDDEVIICPHCYPEQALKGK